MSSLSRCMLADAAVSSPLKLLQCVCVCVCYLMMLVPLKAIFAEDVSLTGPVCIYDIKNVFKVFGRLYCIDIALYIHERLEFVNESIMT